MTDRAHGDTAPDYLPADEERPEVSQMFRRAMMTHPSELAHATAELHRPVHDEFSLVNLMHRAVHVARECVPGVDWCSITTQFRSAPFTPVSSGATARELDQWQYALGDGPSLRALRSQLPVAMDVEELGQHWSELAEAATKAGVQFVLAAPLLNRDPGGSLTVYSRDNGAFAPDALDFVLVLVEYVSRGMSDYAALHSAELQAVQLKEAMLSRAPIEQAKGILMAVHQVSAEEAFEMLRTQSQNSNTKLNQIAASFVAAQSAQPTSVIGNGQDDFQSAFDHAPLGMAMTSPEAVLLSVNPALVRVLRTSSETLTGMSLLTMIHTDDLDEVYRAFAQLREGDSSTVQLSVRLLAADGHPVPVQIAASAVLSGSSSVSEQSGVSHLVMHIQSAGG